MTQMPEKQHRIHYTWAAKFFIIFIFIGCGIAAYALTKALMGEL